MNLQCRPNWSLLSEAPNFLYLDESNKKDYYSVKKMKDKTRCILMVGTSDSGKKVPLAVVDKNKNI